MLDVLEWRVEPSVEEFIDAVEAMSVIEAKVEDVLIRLPAEQVEEPPPRLARECSRIAVRAVGPEHVLLGLVEADESIRDDFGITTETVREEIRRATPPA